LGFWGFGVLESLGLEKYLRRSVTELSVGQQQRVAAARALIGEPELILADEPTSSLDQEHREKFISLLFSLSEKQGSAILFVSHDRTLENLFDRTQSLLEINRASFSTAEEL
jgi:putative ABC transport system ATP-binding protein